MMDIEGLSGRRAPSGLVVAGLGFFLTRFTVTLAAAEGPVQFLVSGGVPLVLGLGLSVFGIALAVGDFEPAFVRSVAVWCVAGAGSMAVLVGLTLAGSDTAVAMQPVRSRTYLSNFLIGGSVGGALTGVYAGRSARQRRDLERQTRRLELVNRLLRDEILNAVTVIRGRAELLQGREDPDSAAAIEKRAEEVGTTVENVKHITRDGNVTGALDDLPVVPCVTSAVEAVRARYPGADVTVDTDRADDAVVRANPLLETVVAELVENAVVYSDAGTPSAEVTVRANGAAVVVAVTDNGPGLPEEQRELIERGEIAAYTDRSTGFGLNLVRLLAGSYGGRVDATVAEAGTTVTLTLPRADTESERTSTGGISRPGVAVATGAGLLAGAVMGLFMQVSAGSVPIIGALYGTMSPLVGWVTHEFHSVVFALAYAGLVRATPGRYDDRLRYYGVAVGWAVALWLVAAGIVMPLWLRLTGFTSMLPNVTGVTLAAHLVWGVTLAALYRHGRRLVRSSRD